MKQAEELYRHRFADASRDTRRAMWGVLCRVVLQRFVEKSARVLDLGAGFCEFINTIECGEKIAVDVNVEVRRHAARDVRTLVGDIPEVLKELADGCTDVVFCSNFFEHLRDKEALLTVLAEIRRLLSDSGRLIVIQPNIRYAYKEYWDFFDHHVPLSHNSLAEALQLAGFAAEEMRPRFLPYTTKTRLPKAAWLVRLYLAMPPAQWLLGKQMLVVARKA